MAPAEGTRDYTAGVLSAAVVESLGTRGGGNTVQLGFDARAAGDSRGRSVSTVRQTGRK